MKKNWPLPIIGIIIVFALAADIFIYEQNVKNQQAIFAATAEAGSGLPALAKFANGNVAPLPQPPAKVAPTAVAPAPLAITPPLSDALSRVTKKPFGIYVRPGFSPVTPERFTGYHTGVDFETTASEQNIDVPIDAICAGKILIKEWASGYGGVVNEACTINGQAVTVTYGHLRLTSIAKKVGQSWSAGEQIGVLGTGYSHETDGERKHLHLAIHKGTAPVISGYVATTAQLKPWLNVLDYLKSTK